MNSIYREMIKSPFEKKYQPSKIELDNFLENSIKVYRILRRFDGKNKDSFFELVKHVFKGRLNINKNLKLEGLYDINDKMIIYTGKFKSKVHNYNAETDDYDTSYEWENVRVETEIYDYKIVVNLVFMDTGEIRQSEWRVDI